MTTKAPLPNQEIKPQAFELTPAKINELGLKPSSLLRTNVEGMQYDCKLKGHYCLAIGWPDGTFCTFGSNQPISLAGIYPVPLQEAYRKSFYDQSYDTWLG